MRPISSPWCGCAVRPLPLLPPYLTLARPAASATLAVLEVDLAENNPATLYRAEYLGNGTFIIRKPKRNPRKLRQLRLKSPNRGMRK